MYVHGYQSATSLCVVTSQSCVVASLLPVYMWLLYIVWLPVKMWYQFMYFYQSILWLPVKIWLPVNVWLPVCYQSMCSYLSVLLYAYQHNVCVPVNVCLPVYVYLLILQINIDYVCHSESLMIKITYCTRCCNSDKKTSACLFYSSRGGLTLVYTINNIDPFTNMLIH